MERHRREFDRLTDDLKDIERDPARSPLGDESMKRLMPPWHLYSGIAAAHALMAAIGDVECFAGHRNCLAISG